MTYSKDPEGQGKIFRGKLDIASYLSGNGMVVMVQWHYYSLKRAPG